jgi:hypothetical protein
MNLRPNRLQSHQAKYRYGLFIGGLFALPKRSMKPPRDGGGVIRARCCLRLMQVLAYQIFSRCLAQQLQLAGSSNGLGAVGSPYLAVNVVDVGLDRAQGDEEVFGDLGVGPSGGKEGKYL